VVKTFKSITESDVNSLRFMLETFRGENLLEQRKMMVGTACQKYKITYQFVQEFSKYITQESFSTSPDLQYDLIESFPELFNIELWLGKDRNEKSIEPIKNEKFIAKYGQDLTEKALLTTRPDKIKEEDFRLFKDKLTFEARKELVNACGFVKESNIDEYMDYIDYKFINDRNNRMSFSNTLIQKIVKNKQLNMRFLISLLNKTNDADFIASILNQKLDIVESGDTFDTELGSFILKVSEEHLGLLFNLLLKYSRNSLSYSFLSRLLTVKDYISEEFILQHLELFKGNALTNEVAKYARFKEYNNVILALKLTE
jgi:hypothetical protein